MTRWTRHIFRYAALTAVTIVAIGIMAWSSMRDDAAAKKAREKLTTALPVVAQTKPLVAVEKIEPSLHEVTAKYSGKIRPWETYSLAFEQSGRIVELGVDESGQALDDGSRVEAGQVLARIDDRVFQARVAEATANLEQASSDLRRVRQVREAGYGGVTEAEFQQALTNEALAKAALDIASKNLKDSVLYSPVDATISRRLAEPGESVMADENVFELVQNQDVLLVVDVPESEIRELQTRMVKVCEAKNSGHGDPESKVYRARVFLETRDRFGRRPPTIDAEVFRIAELADTRTGLFEVEIKVPNPERLLRPGMVATAEVVIDRMSAYQIPETAVLFRGDESFLFGVDQVNEPLQVMFWQVDTVPVATAHRIELKDWIDQGKYLLVPSTSAEIDRVIVRGQQRLSDGQHVRITGSDESEQPQYATPESDEDDTLANRGR